MVDRAPDVQRDLNLAHIFDVFVFQDQVRRVFGKTAADVGLQGRDIQRDQSDQRCGGEGARRP